MPEYHDAVLDLVGGGKTVFWPDQDTPPSRRQQAATYTARSLLAALKRHRATYTVSPATTTTSTPPTTARPPLPQVLNRSVSYTEKRPTHISCPDLRPRPHTPSPILSTRPPHKTRPVFPAAARSHLQTPSPTPSARHAPQSIRTLKPSPPLFSHSPTPTQSSTPCRYTITTPPSSSPPVVTLTPSSPIPIPSPTFSPIFTPTPSPSPIIVRTPSSRPLATPSPILAPSPITTPPPSPLSTPIPTPPLTPVCGRSGRSGSEWLFGAHTPSATTASTPPTRGWVTAPPSPTQRPRGRPPPASRSPGAGEDQWVLCTLARPPRPGRVGNPRVRTMNHITMAQNTAQYNQWLQETPKTSKGGGAALLTRALSFKGRLGGKLGGMKSPLKPGGKIIKVEPSGGSESLDSKVEDVWRSLDFYRSVVEKRITKKSINDMLPGSATVVLDMVLALNLALKPAFSNQNSSAVSAAVAGVHHSLAELVRWSDQLLLHDQHHHNTLTVQEVVAAVRDAVQALVNLAAEKNLYLPDSTNTPSSHDNNNSEKPSPYYSKRHSDVSSHRNSLPEIKADSPTERSRNLLSVGDGALKLSHSRSSDSILTGPDLDNPPPKPPLPLGRSDGAPPLPPKRSNSKVNSVENILNCPSYMNTQPNYSFPHSHILPYSNSSPHNHTSTRNHSSPHSHNSAHTYSSPLNHSPRESASDQVSPASSVDSMTQEPPASRSSLNSCGSQHYDRPDLDFDSALHRNLRISVDPSSPRLTDSTDSGFPSVSSVHNFSFSSTAASNHSQSFSQSRTQTFKSSSSSSSSQVSSNRVICTTQRIVSCTTTRSSTSSSTSCSSSASEGEKLDHSITLNVPPKLPVKQRGPRCSGESRDLDEGRGLDDGRTSTYDNLGEVETVDGCIVRLRKEDPGPRLPPKTGGLQLGGSSSSSSSSVNSGYSTSMFSTSSSSSSHMGGGSSMVQLRRHHHKVETTYVTSSDDDPPPLPLKKKHVHDYMKLFGQVSEPNPSELLRHSVHQIHLASNLDEAHYNEHDSDFFHPLSVTSFMPGRLEQVPHQPPPLPIKTRRITEGPPPQLGWQSLPASPAPPTPCITPRSPSDPIPIMLTESHTEEKAEPEEVIIQDQSMEVERKEEFVKNEEEEEIQGEEEEEEEDSLLDLLDVKEYLVLKKDGEEGPDIRGGPVDGLVVHASKANKNDFLYQEAFLTTYRTFVKPEALIKKLLWRYNRFVSNPNLERQKAARNAFSLLVRVVDDLAMVDLSIATLETLTDFEYTLLSRGDLLLARALRKKIVEKLNARNMNQDPRDSLTIVSQNVTTKQNTLLNFKSQEVAEQMTLLDAELFLTMEISEVLLWAREQNEERSPNLTTFTEHFNKMSYWARSRILEQEDSKDREKYVMKFIKIMKHLRKMNNFNSYLALLSALDSAPIRRLEWQRTITDGLKEYCALIDSSSSFRAYRQALSDSKPPCIPYIGLILQDLTFVNIGNSDNLPDSNINFSKRWQQYNILDNMKRFKKGQYTYKKNEDIIAFLNNFEQYLNEEALWSISKSIKPRGGKRN